jgi:hypothetical protein
MTGSDERSRGGIEQLVLSWGVGPEQACRIAAIARTLVAGACPEDNFMPLPREVAVWIPQQERARESYAAADDAPTDWTREVRS